MELGVISLLVTALTTSSESVGVQAISAIASGVFGLMVSSIYEFVDTHDQGLKTWFDTQIRYREKNIRLSFSYLFRIEVDGKYLLVRGHRMNNQFQPIGGVYKVYDEGKSFLNQIRAIADTSMGNFDETDDLRMQIKGKDYFKFWDWFESMRDREYDPRREFEEELIDTQILPAEAFQKLKYRKVWTHNAGVTYSQPLRIHEVVYADIFEISSIVAKHICVEFCLGWNGNCWCNWNIECNKGGCCCKEKYILWRVILDGFLGIPDIHCQNY